MLTQAFIFIPGLTFSAEVLIYLKGSQCDVAHENESLELILLITLRTGQVLCRDTIQTLPRQMLKGCLRAAAAPKLLGVFSFPERANPNPFR